MCLCVCVGGSAPYDEGIPAATHAPCWQISVAALGDGEEEDPSDESQTARLGLVFSHTPTYPDEPPLIKCRSIKGLFDSELGAVQKLMEQRANESLGMSMIFDLVGEAKEWMRNRAGVVDVVEETPEQIAQRLEEEAEARLKAMRATGTAVTVDSFNAWVGRFEAEQALALLRAPGGGAGGTAAGGEGVKVKKMTGRQYFEERTAAQMEEEEGEGGDDDDFDDDDFDDDFDDDDDDLLEFIKGGGGIEEGDEDALSEEEGAE